MSHSVSGHGLNQSWSDLVGRAPSETASGNQAAPGWTRTNELPARASRAKDDFGLSMSRRTRTPASATEEMVSRPRDVSKVRVRVEADLLGPQKLKSLDRMFGKAEPPRGWGLCRAVNPWERVGKHPMVHPQRTLVPAEGGRPVDLKTMLDLEGLKAGSVEYMFVVSLVGALVIGEEVPAPGATAIDGRMPFLGHPTLTGGGPGRIAGELRYDHEKEEFFINDRSGRFNLRRCDRGPQQLENVAARFRAAGLPVSVRHGEGY